MAKFIFINMQIRARERGNIEALLKDFPVIQKWKLGILVVIVGLQDAVIGIII